jgi:hypothetical protein
MNPFCDIVVGLQHVQVLQVSDIHAMLATTLNEVRGLRTDLGRLESKIDSAPRGAAQAPRGQALAAAPAAATAAVIAPGILDAWLSRATCTSYHMPLFRVVTNYNQGYDAGATDTLTVAELLRPQEPEGISFGRLIASPPPGSFRTVSTRIYARSRFLRCCFFIFVRSNPQLPSLPRASGRRRSIARSTRSTKTSSTVHAR